MKLKSIALAIALLLPQASGAHFLLNYTDKLLFDRPENVPMAVVFWHPHANGHAMHMTKPEQFYMVHKGQKTDLSDRLTPKIFQGAENNADAFHATIPITRAGDYVVVTVPAPYFEASEDSYIQQFTKVILNKSAMPTDWDQPLGLKAEILPMNKPYNIITGSTFTGQVLMNGTPVAGAEIEIEYLASKPNIDNFTAQKPTVSPMPGGSINAVSDANGMFTFGIPRSGYWGFAALGVGPDKMHNDKELSQDAVLWIHAEELK